MEEQLTTRILIEIRDEIRRTREDLNGRLDQTNERLDQTNERLDQTNQRLGVLARITQGIDTRLSKIETGDAFIPARVQALEERVTNLELAQAGRDD